MLSITDGKNKPIFSVFSNFFNPFSQNNLILQAISAESFDFAAMRSYNVTICMLHLIQNPAREVLI